MSPCPATTMTHDLLPPAPERWATYSGPSLRLSSDWTSVCSPCLYSLLPKSGCCCGGGCGCMVLCLRMQCCRCSCLGESVVFPTTTSCATSFVPLPMPLPTPWQSSSLPPTLGPGLASLVTFGEKEGRKKKEIETRRTGSPMRAHPLLWANVNNCGGGGSTSSHHFDL